MYTPDNYSAQYLYDSLTLMNGEPKVTPETTDNGEVVDWTKPPYDYRIGFAG